VKEWAELALRAKTGDVDAFGQIVRRFQDMACGYAYSILGDFHLAEDAAQEAFIACYQQLAKLQEPDAFPAWFRKIVFTHCGRMTRGKTIPTVSLEQVLDVPMRASDPSVTAEARDLHGRVLEAIGALPDQERTVTTLCCINGYSLGEVGEFLEIPVTTVKNRLHSARAKLREGMMAMVEETLRVNAPGDEFTGKIKGKIERLEWVQRWLTSLGCIEGYLNYLGHRMPAGWVAGAAGYAFSMRIQRELCPVGIIAWGPPAELAKNVGYETELLAPEGEVAEQQRIVWSATEEALRTGMPCIGFGMEVWQSYLIYGYDDTGYYYMPVMEGDGHFLREKMGVEVPCVMTFIRKVEPADTVTTVRDALDFAVRYSSSPDIAPGWGGPPENFRAGIQAYDLWTEAIEEGRANGLGMGFNSHTYAELRRLGVEFLQTASGRLGKAGPLFEEAIGHYQVAADGLRVVADLFPMPASPEHIKDRDRREQAIQALTSARDAEKLGLGAFAQIVREL